jgi:succinate-semialdehyde dehydrogenase / glutarate-semialdehyde dehydrogenase
MTKSAVDDWNHNWIDGEKVRAEKSIEVTNPADGTVVGHVPHVGQDETTRAIDAAWRAFAGWSRMLPVDRARYLHAWADNILARQNEFAQLMSLEQGKPVAEAAGEINASVGFIRWYAEEGRRVYGEVIAPSRVLQRITVLRQPVGVVGLITPWNFPAAMVLRKMSPALAAGCTVVLKPAKQTPLIAIALIDCLIETGIPAGVVNVVTGDAGVISDALLADPRVRKVSFTGSTEVGKSVMRRAADTVKRLSLELGGNAPAIVFPDADLDLAAAAILDNKFENCGQVCNGINLVYAHSSIAEALANRLAEGAAKIHVGHGQQSGVQMGPLIDANALRKVEDLVHDAVTKGAHVKTGGQRLTQFDNGNFYAPTVLTGVTRDMDLAHDEVFGPVCPVLTFESEAEVLAKSNDTPYGLSAYVFTRDVGRVYRMAEGLDVGMVAVNSTSLSFPQAPFGGIKESGQGREGGHHGIDDYLEYKFVSLTLPETGDRHDE